jgi:predicted  nucleic acid-binding Zn-ribbon protein
MSEIEVILTIISILGTISSIGFGYLAFRKNDKQEVKGEGKSEGVIISDIGYIKSSIDRIEKTLEKLQEQYADLHSRVIKLETEHNALKTTVENHLKRQVKKGGE